MHDYLSGHLHIYQFPLSVVALLVVVCCWLLVVVGCCWLLLVVVVGCCWLLLVVVRKSPGIRKDILQAAGIETSDEKILKQLWAHSSLHC